MNCNALSAFAVPFHGLAWFKSEVSPPNPGLAHDFLPEIVRLGHRHGMKVFAYINVSANRYWSALYPAESHDGANRPASSVVLTRRYLDFLRRQVQEIFDKTGADGLHLDWLFSPYAKQNASSGQPDKRPRDGWLACEREMWRELLGEDFPAAADGPPAPLVAEFHRRALVRAWDTIRQSAKTARPDCILRYNCPNLESEQTKGTTLFQEADWLVGERGDIPDIVRVKKRVGKHTRLLTCLAVWNQKDPLEMLAAIDAANLDIGLYGFATPDASSLPPPVKTLLAKPVTAFPKGDQRNLAVLARTYNGLPLGHVAK
jgi:hypothetical protein